MALTFHPQKLTTAKMKDMLGNPSFNRIALQHYTTNGTDFDLVAQMLSPARHKIGPPVILLERIAGDTYTPTREFVFGQYEVTLAQMKDWSKQFSVDLIFNPKKGEINPESTDYDANGNLINPSPPAPPPNP
jgi:hypothetical protein